MDDQTVQALARDIRTADHAVVFTGAGISTPSGIPDFRSEGGLWDTYDREDFHYRRFRADPADFWADRLDLRETLYGDGDVAPNVAHEAIATLEAEGHVDALVTQNVDGLHEAAGCESVIRLHGTSQRAACESCDARVPAAPVFERAAEGELPPRCERCDGVLRPDVVLFGESMPTGALGRARQHARQADVFLAVGSSLTVEPAASLPSMADRHGATVGVVTLDSTPIDADAAHVLRADVTAALPGLVEALARGEG